MIISGYVQGVGFRYFTTNLAKNYEVAGWVRNLATGDLEIHVEGDKGPVAGFLKELKIGPKWSRIGKFQIEWLPCEGEFESFSVRF